MINFDFDVDDVIDRCVRYYSHVRKSEFRELYLREACGPVDHEFRSRRRMEWRSEISNKLHNHFELGSDGYFHGNSSV